MNHTRRSVLRAGAGVGAATLATLAGCLGEPEDAGGSGADGTYAGYGAFFAVWDWAEAISGEDFSFENPVETGEMGHGWEPPADLQRDVAGTDAFVYLDTPEFAWAQDLAADLEGEHDVALIDGMDGLSSQLLPAQSEPEDDREPDYDHDFDPDSVEVAEFDIYDSRTGENVAYFHGDHWHGGLPEIEVDGEVTIEGVFEDSEGRVLPLDESSPFQFDAAVVDGAPDDVIEIHAEDEQIRFEGISEGRTQIVFELSHDGEVLWDTSSDLMGATVVEELSDSDAPEFYDPHVWVDPVLAQDIVETIAAGLGEIDPDNAESYEANAADYTERLAGVDEQLADVVDAAEREVAVFAGHDSYQYIEERYGFELHTPVGISPDEVESSGDISEMIDIIEEHDIDTILYDPFEVPNPDEDIPQMVEVLLEETDATDYEPLSPVEGTTAEWEEEGYGWVEQMEEINIPSLRAALGSE